MIFLNIYRTRLIREAENNQKRTNSRDKTYYSRQYYKGKRFGNNYEEENELEEPLSPPKSAPARSVRIGETTNHQNHKLCKFLFPPSMCLLCIIYYASLSIYRDYFILDILIYCKHKNITL